jgi:hypothetical protein
MDTIDEAMNTVQEESVDFTAASNAVGASEFAIALSNNLNAHGSASQKLLGAHGLVQKYQRIAQEK